MRRRPWQSHLNARSGARFALQVEPATQPIRDDVVDDVEPEPGCTVKATGREERIERQAFDLRRHAAAIIVHGQLDLIGTGRAYPDIDGSVEPVRECVRKGIDDEMGQDLSERPWVAVDHKTGLAVKVECDRVILQVPCEMRQDLLGQCARIEAAPIRLALIESHLLEGLNPFGGAPKIVYQLGARILHEIQKRVQARTLEPAAGGLCGELRGIFAAAWRRWSD